MASWGERLEAAVALWREGGDRRGAAAALRGIVVSADGAVAAEASHVLGLVLAEDGDQDGARAAHRSVVSGGHPRWAQRSAIVLGTLLMDEGAPAMAWRPLRIAASGADPQLAGMAELSLAHVLRDLGDPDAAELARRRALNGGDPAIAELAAETGEIRPPDDRVERERGGWEAFESVVAVLEDEDPEAIDTVLTALDAMLSLGAPQLCTQAATRLYSVHARLGEFDECRRVMEHAIAVGDPAERCRAEKLLGAALLDLGERAEALEAYRRAAEDHRPEIRLDALIEEAKLVRELGDEEEARRILGRVVESGHPRYALEAHACLGQVLSEAGEVEEAVECWRIVFDSESEFRSDGVHFLGTLLHGLPDGDPRRAEVIELLDRAALFDDPDVSSRARLLTAQADLADLADLADQAERGPGEEVEQAVDDCDAALERLRAGEVGAARTLLRRVIDAGLGDRSTRAMMMLATLELGEGDTEQADELLEYVADGDDLASGFAAAVQRRLITHGEGGRTHPVLTGLVEYQRLGREIGIARYEEAARHPDPAVSAPAKCALAQARMRLGVPPSRVAELFGEAAAAGVPAALSQAAVLSWLLRSGEDADEAVALLRQAHADGEPALAPWVAQALGTAVEERDPDAALAAFGSVSASGHPGLAAQAEAEMARIFEERGDLAAAAATHERLAARGGVPAARHAWLLGFTRARMRDLGAARAAFAAVPEDDPELAAEGAFARHLLDREFPAAADALASVPGHALPLACALLVEAANTWQAEGAGKAAEAALSLAVEHGSGGDAQKAALLLGALRNDEGDRAGAAEAWAVAAGGDDYAELLQDAVKALLAAGRATEARDLQAAAAGEGPHVDVLLGWNLHELGDHDAAAARLEAVIACGAEDGFEGEAVARASVLLARIVAGRGDAAEAVRHVRHALVLFDRRREEGDPDAGPLAAEAAYDLGEYLTASGDGQAARHADEQAASGAPGLVAARARERLGVASPEERAVLAAEDGDRPRAVGLLTQEHGEPLLAELHLALCEGDDEAARGWLRRSAGTGHAAAAAELVGGTAVQRLQQWMNGAQELYEAVLEYGPPAQVAVVCEHFGYEYGERGDTDAAIAALEHGGRRRSSGGAGLPAAAHRDAGVARRPPGAGAGRAPGRRERRPRDGGRRRLGTGRPAEEPRGPRRGLALVPDGAGERASRERRPHPRLPRLHAAQAG
ncbi:hypothetical protein [Actinomadura sp. KC345]|uniref:hypothetical protein n=1 Tax=Actinomadura sp. KC345 TaxID=2530371 RepID=UPI001FB804A6|nr:hypothetical protein [Actinomadura sp. KC345]